MDFSQIKLIAMDVDGVLTDGGMYYFENGGEAKKFSARDGMAIKLIKEKGIKVVFITQENTMIVERRAKKLGVLVIQGVEDKVVELKKLCSELNTGFGEVAYVGDDVNDIRALGIVGIAICPRDAVEEVRKICHIVTDAKGGEGVIREVYERFIKM